MSNVSKSMLYVHIGGAKCGSSSIQYFLESNKAELRKQGFIVPSVHMTTQGECNGAQLEYFQRCFETRADSFTESKAGLKENLTGLRDEYIVENDGNLPKIIVSAENLSCWHRYNELFDDLEDDFEIKIIMYIRRQDEYLISYWQQWSLKVEEDFWAWMLKSLGEIGDWSHTLEPWIEMFGSENIIVRRFARKYFVDGDLIKDFSMVVGVDSANMTTKFTRNASFNDGVVAIASSVKDVFDGAHDNRFYQMIGEWGGEEVLKKHMSQLMSYEQKVALLKYYKKSNEKINRQFFDDGESLFDPVNNKHTRLDTSATTDGRIGILARLMFGCYQETVKHRGAKLKMQDLLDSKNKGGGIFKIFDGKKR